MLISVQGILLKTIKHSDSSAIVHVFSRQQGRRAYFLRGISKKKNSPRALLYPLAIQELQVIEKENKSLGQVKELGLAYPSPELISNPMKSSVALFLTEILEKSIVENYQNEVLFDFLENSIKLLDAATEVANFHIWFLIRLSKHFGFYPSSPAKTHGGSNLFFNLEDGSFLSSRPILESYAEPPIAMHIIHFLGMNFDAMSTYKLKTEERAELLRTMVSYFKIHVPNLNHIASLDVLETVFEF